MAMNIEILVKEGELSQEVVDTLKGQWITDCDTLYARMQAAIYSDNPNTVIASEKELGLDEGKLSEFMKYIEGYVSPGIINAPKPKEYPTGCIKPKKYPLRGGQ